MKKGKKSSNSFLHFIASLLTHVILFYSLDLIPHNMNTISWKNTNKINIVKKIKNDSKPVEIINMVPPKKPKDEKFQKSLYVSNKADIIKSKDIVKPEDKKIPINEKLVQNKDTKELLSKASALPRMVAEKGVRSITEKTPLKSHLIDKINEKPIVEKISKEIKPEKKVIDQEKIKKEIVAEIDKKNLLSKINIKENKKIIIVKNIEQKPDKPLITPELDKIVKELSRNQILKEGNPLGLAENKLQNLQGQEQPIKVSNSGEEKLTKSFDRKIDQEKSDLVVKKDEEIENPKIIKVQTSKISRSIVQSGLTKQALKISSDVKKPGKQIKISSAQEIEPEKTIEKKSNLEKIASKSENNTTPQEKTKIEKIVSKVEPSKNVSTDKKINVIKAENITENKNIKFAENEIETPEVLKIDNMNDTKPIKEDDFTIKTTKKIEPKASTKNIKASNKQIKISSSSSQKENVNVNTIKVSGKVDNFTMPEVKEKVNFTKSSNVTQNFKIDEQISKTDIETINSEKNKTAKRAEKSYQQTVPDIKNEIIEKEDTEVKQPNLVKVHSTKLMKTAAIPKTQQQVNKNETIINNNTNIKKNNKQIKVASASVSEAIKQQNIKENNNTSSDSQNTNVNAKTENTNKNRLIKKEQNFIADNRADSAQLTKIAKMLNREIIEVSSLKDIDKLHDTSVIIITQEDFMKISTQVEKDISVVKKEIIAVKNKIEENKNKKTEKNVSKIKRMTDRSITGAAGVSAKVSPLSNVTRGGVVRKSSAGENYSNEEIKELKKIEDKIQVFKKSEAYIPKEQKIKQELPLATETFKIKNEDKKINIEPVDVARSLLKIDKILKQQEENELDEKKKQKIEEISLFKEISVEAKSVATKIEQEKTTVNEKQKSSQTITKNNFSEMKKTVKEIKTAVAKEPDISVVSLKYPTIMAVMHNAVKTLGKGDEFEVTLEGDAGQTAYFDIGLYRTKITMNEVSPGVYKGIYRVISGDNINNADVSGYLMNKANNQSFMSASNTINIDTSPLITIIAPINTFVDSQIQTVIGLVDDPKIKNIILSLNGSSKHVSVAESTFKCDIKLEEGRNVVEIQATDSHGTTGTDRIEITYATYKGGPRIAILNPSDGTVVDVSKNPTIQIQGTISDPAITKARLIGNSVTLDMNVSDGEFSQKVLLFQDAHSFVVEAIDDKGMIGMSEPITIRTVGLKQYDAIIYLRWDTPKTNMEMVLRSPSGKTISQKSHTTSTSEGKIEYYKKGSFGGMEVITLTRAVAGVYSILVNNYSSPKDVVNINLRISFNDIQNSNKMSSKVFNNQPVKVGDSWEVSFVCLPEDISNSNE